MARDGFYETSLRTKAHAPRHAATENNPARPSKLPLMALPFEKIPLFRDMPSASRERLGHVLTLRDLADGEVLLAEGTPTDDLFVLAEGTMRVSRKHEDSEDTHDVAEVSEGDVLGEMSIFDGLPTTATVVAKGPCRVWVVPFSQLRPLGSLVSGGTPEAHVLSEVYDDLVASMVKVMASRLREMSKADLAKEKERAALGLFVVDVLVLLAGYAVLLAALPKVKPNLPGSSSYLSLPLIGLFAYGGIRFIRRTGKPLASFGLGFTNLFGSLGLALVVTPLLLLLATGMKAIALAVHEPWKGYPLFERTDVVARLSEPNVVRLLTIYAVSCVAQEIIVRGALQSGLWLFLRGRFAHARAILVAALLFSVNHLHMSFFFAAAMFVPGVVWGWMFAKRPHVLGVTLSHLVGGAFVFFILGINLP